MPGTMFEGENAACSISGEIVLRIAVELEHADLDRRIVGVRPDLGEVERVVPVLADVGFRHDLHLHLPLREIAAARSTSNRSSCVDLARAADDLGRLRALVQCLMALLRLEVELHPVALALRR